MLHISHYGFMIRSNYCSALTRMESLRLYIHGYFSYLGKGLSEQYLIDCELQIQIGDKLEKKNGKNADASMQGTRC